MDEELRAEEGPQDPEHEPAEARADLDPPAEDPPRELESIVMSRIRSSISSAGLVLWEITRLRV